MNPMVHCQLWMGSLEPNMTESFIMAAFQKMGEHPQNIKMIINKYTGEPANYCFVHFGADEAAINAMHKLNGKPIPGTSPVVRFRLDSRRSKAGAPSERGFSLWVGELTTDVDDYNLYSVFCQKYWSIKTAKVVLDSSGLSKGYGFVEFGNEEEQKHALRAMDGYGGLGSKLLRVCKAVPKRASSDTGLSQQLVTVLTDYNQQQSQQYYDPAYWQNCAAAWSGYYGGSGEETAGATPFWNTPAPDTSHLPPPAADQNLALTDHKMPLDTEQLNRETMEKERSLWDALEASRWLSADIMEVY